MIITNSIKAKVRVLGFIFYFSSENGHAAYQIEWN